jgi:hypothetical protein
MFCIDFKSCIHIRGQEDRFWDYHKRAVSNTKFTLEHKVSNTNSIVPEMELHHLLHI